MIVLQINQRACDAFGLSVHEDAFRNQMNIFKSVCCAVVLCGQVVSMVASLFDDALDLNKMTYAIYCIAAMLICASQLIYFIWRREDLNEIFKTLQDLVDKREFEG